MSVERSKTTDATTKTEKAILSSDGPYKKMEMILTINGDARAVEVMDDFKDGSRLSTVYPVGLYQKRQGSKTWAETVFFWKQKDGRYETGQTTTILNRAGYRLIGWSESSIANRSRHSSAVVQA